jgi:nucleoside-diphosphate-sugar epimerase
MAVLIVGGGLVGSQIARILAEQGERPVVMDRSPQPEALGDIVELGRIELVSGDVLNPLALSQAILRYGITAIAHTAAYPMLTAGAQKEPYAAIQLNVMGTVNVLEAARIHGVKRVAVSSSSVLNQFFAGGEAGGDLGREEALPRPTTFYAATKQAIESIGLNYARHCGIEFAALRYGPVAGPWKGAGGGEPSNVFRRVLRSAIAGEVVSIPSTSSEWVYSKDAAAGTVLALRAPKLETGVFNLTMGRVVTPQDFADALTSAIPGVEFRIEAPRPGAPAARRKPAEIALARKVLGYEPKYGLPEAIRDYAAWYQDRF